MINAIAANIVLFVIRYSPFMLYNEIDSCSSLIRSSLDFRLEDSQDFYIPVFEGQKTYSELFAPSFKLPNGKIMEQLYDKKILVPFKEREVK